MLVFPLEGDGIQVVVKRHDLPQLRPWELDIVSARPTSPHAAIVLMNERQDVTSADVQTLLPVWRSLGLPEKAMYTLYGLGSQRR